MLSHAPAWDFHAPTWATNMSPNLVYFKAHSRGFDGGGGVINGTSGNIKMKPFGLEKEREKAIGVQSLRGLESRHLISFFLLYSHDYEF